MLESSDVYSELTVLYDMVSLLSQQQISALPPLAPETGPAPAHFLLPGNQCVGAPFMQHIFIIE